LRLLLDANLSSKRVGEPLRLRAHDVRAIADEPELDGLDDELVLELASQDERILVTRNSRDFAPISRSWAEAGREHAGVILIWTLTHRQHAEIISGIESWIEQMPDASSWRGIVVAI
jgi:predicted nuclease of predicted toxin-antitoxin system